MAAYKLSQNAAIVIRTADGASIPTDPANADYQVYQAWIGAGNTPDAADPSPPLTLAARRERKAKLAARRGLKDGRL